MGIQASSGPRAAIFRLCRGKTFDLVTSKAIFRDCSPAGCHPKSSALVFTSIRTANLFAIIALRGRTPHLERDRFLQGPQTAASHCSDSAARVSSPFSRRTRMRIEKWFVVGVVTTAIFCTSLCTSANAQQFEQKLYSEMRWRCIGPFRGGRTVAISGVPHQPNVFYMAAVNGGVWKTTHFGNTWNPIFDDRSEERRVGKEGRSRWSPYH